MNKSGGNGIVIRMISIFIGIMAIGLAAYAGWHFFFGVPNPPLKSGKVSIGPAAPAPQASTSSSATAIGRAAAGKGSDAGASGSEVRIDGATWNVEIASTAVEQARGLSYRPSLGANDGMLFLFSSPAIQHFWMKDMNFPLDMIWISGTTVAGFAQNVPAPAAGAALWSLPVYSSPDGVDKVLEVNAGAVAQYGIRVGDAVSVIPAR